MGRPTGRLYLGMQFAMAARHLVDMGFHVVL